MPYLAASPLLSVTPHPNKLLCWLIGAGAEHDPHRWIQPACAVRTVRGFDGVRAEKSAILAGGFHVVPYLSTFV